MKKLLIVTTILIFIMTFYATSGLFAAEEKEATVEERVSTLEAAAKKFTINGSIRVRGWHKDNYYSFDDSNDADEDRYIDQRLRIGAKFKSSDYVTAVVRVDLGEGAWGNIESSGYSYTSSRWTRPTDETEFQVDRGYIQIQPKSFRLRVGQQFIAYGNKIAVDQNSTAIDLVLRTPVSIRLDWAKLEEGDERNDADTNEDEDFYGLDLQYVGKQHGTPYGGGVFFAMIKDKKVEDDSPYCIAVYGSGNFGKLAMKAELDYFGGENSGANTDYMGTQLYLNTTYKLIKSLKLGASIYYASGTTSANEKQLTAITDAGGSYLPFSHGPFDTLFRPLPGDVFDPSGNSAGVSGFSITGDYTTPIKGLLLTGLGGYLTPQEDTALENLIVFTFSAKYDFGAISDKFKNATIAGLLSTTKPKYEDNTPDDAAIVAGLKLQYDF